MPVLGVERFSEAYREVKTGSAAGNCTVLVFVAEDCDSLCASRILTSLLRRDDILHNVIPVSSYGVLGETFKEYVEDQEEIRSVFLINCGAVVDLTETFGELREDIKLYLIDHHRPMRYENARHDQIVVIDDGTVEEHIARLEESDGDSDQEGDGKRRKVGENGESVQEPASPGTKKRRKRRQFREYYQGAFYGMASSSLMYNLSQQLNKADRELLWLAIVGVTEMFLLERVSRDKYNMQVAELQDEVSRTCSEDAQDMTTMDSQGQSLLLKAAEDHRIVFEEDFKFMMYRHWSLLESMRHSDYIAAKFEVWTSVGQKKLKTMIAQMGIPLKDAEQSYYHMSPKSKRALRDLMVEVGKEFGLDDVTYGSFHLRNGYKFQLSASDAVYGITALLAGYGHRQASDDDSSPEDLRRRNFWEAFDALSTLSSTTTEKIEEGIHKAIELQRTVVKQGSHMLSKRIITTQGVFRYAYLKDTADTHLFLNTQSLNKLAHFLVAHYREKFPLKPRPFVLCALDNDRDAYMVVALDGTPGTTASGEVGRNVFGASFAKAAEKTNARVNHDGFETSFMEVEKDDIYKFMEYLHSGLC